MSADRATRDMRTGWLAGLWLVVALMIGAPLSASPLWVSPEDDLAARLAEFPDDVAVALAPGTYRGPIFLEGRRLLLSAPEGATIEGDSNGPTLWISGGSVAIEGLTITGGGPGQPALGIEEAEVSLDRVRLDNPEGMALYARGARLRVDGSSMSGGGQAGVFISRSIETAIAGSRIEAPAGIAVAVQSTPRFSASDSDISGGEGLMLAGVERAEVARSAIRASAGSALPLGEIGELDIEQSALISEGAVISTDFADAEVRLELVESLVAGRAPGLLGIAASPRADVTIAQSVVLSLAPADAPLDYLTLFQGQDFVPLIEDTAILGPARSALVLDSGAGIIAKRSVLAGSEKALENTGEDTPAGALGETLLSPGAPLPAWLEPMLDGPTRRLSAAGAGADAPALLAAELAAALAPEQAPLPADEAVALALAFLADLDELRAERLAATATLGELRVEYTDAAGIIREAPGLRMIALGGGDEDEPLVSESPTLAAIAPGEYLLAVPALGLSQPVRINAGPQRLLLDAPDALVLTMRLGAEEEAGGNPELILPLVPREARARALAALEMPRARYLGGAPRADAPAPQVARALPLARDWLARVYKDEILPPEDIDARYRFDLTTDLAMMLLAFYGDPVADAAILSGFDIYPDWQTERLEKRLQLTALLEARAGRLRVGVLARRLERPSASDRLVPAILLHRNGIGQGRQALLADLALPLREDGARPAEPGEGYSPYEAAQALMALFDVAGPAQVPQALAVLEAAGAGASLPDGAAGAALALVAAHGAPEDLARALALRGPFTMDDMRYLLRLAADPTPLFDLFAEEAPISALYSFLRTGALYRDLPRGEREARIDAMINAIYSAGVREEYLRTGYSPIGRTSWDLESEVILAGEAVREQVATFAYSDDKNVWGLPPDPIMVQPWRESEIAPSLEEGQRWSRNFVRMLGLLPTARAQAILDEADLSAWPEPELLRAGLALVSRWFVPGSDDYNLPQVRPADGSFIFPFAIADRRSQEDYDNNIVSGAMHGLLFFTPRLLGERLELSVRLEQASYYFERCTLAMAIATGGDCPESFWKNSAFTGANAAAVIANARLIRYRAGGESVEIPLTRRTEPALSVFTAAIGPDDLDGLALAFDLTYAGGQRHPVVIPLWPRWLAALERRNDLLRQEIAGALNEAAPDAGALFELAEKARAAGLVVEEARLRAAAGAAAGDPVEGYLSGGERLLQARASEEALALLAEGLAQMPDQGDLMFALGVVAESAGRFEQAARAFGRLAELFPADREAATRAGIAALLSGQRARAGELLAGLDVSAPGPETRLLAALATGRRDMGAYRDDLAELAGLRARAASPPDPAQIEGLLSPGAAPPEDCLLAAYAGAWQAGAGEGMEVAAYLDATRRLCPARSRERALMEVLSR